MARHKLSNINIENKSASCSVCGVVQFRHCNNGTNKGSNRCINIIYAEKIRGRNGKEITSPRPNSCDVCGSTKKICYDHDHATGSHRGWLCNRCNIVIGLVGDNPTTLLGLASYLK